MTSDLSRFFRTWLKSPMLTGAVSPSGKALAKAMANEVAADGEWPVLELGPGTGVFTRTLLDRGVNEAALTLVEAMPAFVERLEVSFPQARILHMDAVDLARKALYEDASVAAVVSSLPLLAIAPEHVASIVSGAFLYLRSGGAFYQYTYGLQCPVPRATLDRLGLEASRIGRTFRNIPPAAVYRITRVRAPEGGHAPDGAS